MFRKGVGVIAAGCVWLSVTGAAAAVPAEGELTVRVSPQAGYVTHVSLKDQNFLSKLEDRAIRLPSNAAPISDTYLSAWNDQTHTKTIYTVDQGGSLYDEAKQQRLELSASDRSKLLKQVELARAAHYGRMIPWEEAKQKIALKDNVKVVDLETGMAFNAQRRAGQLHADVQPLTKEDTAIMKRIYKGKWSWHRKAVLVQAGNQVFAASMHGMPHGGDGIPDNDFSGHFCIHFLGSKTHGSGQADPGHQLMVLKAAGKLNAIWTQPSPYPIVRTFIIALNLKEFEILKQTYMDSAHEELQYYMKEQPLIAVNHRKTEDLEGDFSELLAYELPLKVKLIPAGSAPRDKIMRFKIMRLSPLDPWKISSIDVQ
ncbi:hypothetical protein ACFPYJ_13890 [Paenibacillus solisilvae]|uniref:Uncharacterized protein n=1 Tax=Paenibacillus solisilvae TaxID=2486751 RepID=A0ABW0VXM6_9BACL